MPERRVDFALESPSLDDDRGRPTAEISNVLSVEVAARRNDGDNNVEAEIPVCISLETTSALKR